MCQAGIRCGTDLKISRHGHQRLVAPRVPADHTRAMDLIATGAVPVADLITNRLPLSRFPEALESIANGSALKVTIEPVGTT